MYSNINYGDSSLEIDYTEEIDTSVLAEAPEGIFLEDDDDLHNHDVGPAPRPPRYMDLWTSGPHSFSAPKIQPRVLGLFRTDRRPIHHAQLPGSGRHNDSRQPPSRILAGHRLPIGPSTSHSPTAILVLDCSSSVGSVDHPLNDFSPPFPRIPVSATQRGRSLCGTVPDVYGRTLPAPFPQRPQARDPSTRSRPVSARTFTTGFAGECKIPGFLYLRCDPPLRPNDIEYRTASMSPRLAARSYPRFGRCGGLAKSVKSPYPSPDSDSTLESRLEADTDRLRAASRPRSELRGRLSTHDRSLTALVGSSVSRNYGVPNDPPPSSLLSPRPDSVAYLRRPTTPRRERPGVGSGRPPARHVTPTEPLAKTARTTNPVTPTPNPAVRSRRTAAFEISVDGIRPLRRPHGFPTTSVDVRSWSSTNFPRGWTAPTYRLPSIAAPLSRRETPPARERRTLNQFAGRYTGLRLASSNASQSARTVDSTPWRSCWPVSQPREQTYSESFRTDRRLAVGGPASPENHRRDELRQKSAASGRPPSRWVVGCSLLSDFCTCVRLEFVVFDWWSLQ